MNDLAGRSRPPVPQSIWWLLGALVLLVIGGVVYGIQHFDRDLTTRAETALQDAGIPATVHFDGRHGYLEGTLEYETDVQTAVAVVKAVRGVANVDAEMEFLIAGAPELPPARDPAPPPTTPRVTISVIDGRIDLTGALGSRADAEALVAAAIGLFGPSNVREQLRIEDGLEESSWVPRLPGLMTYLAGFTRGRVVIGGEVSVRGEVADDETRTAIGDAVRAAVDPLPVTDLIEVVTPMPPSLIAEGRDGTVTLQGSLPDQDNLDRIVAAAGDVYGSANVVNELSIGRGVLVAEWLDVAPGIFVRTAGLDPWRVEIVAGTLTVFGRGPADGTVPSAIDSFESIGGGLTVDAGDVEVAAQAVAAELTDLLEGTATFRPGSTELSADALDLLDSAIELLIANPSTRLTVEGHTDSQGSDASNLALSQARAEAVVTYLVQGGVAPDRLFAVGYGEARPIADNDTSEGRAQNRRIEFIVEEGSS
jgi:OOP family OmpA-OmpF porin